MIVVFVTQLIFKLGKCILKVFVVIAVDRIDTYDTLLRIDYVYRLGRYTSWNYTTRPKKKLLVDL